MEMTTECKHYPKSLTIVDLIPDGTTVESGGHGISNTVEMVRIVALCNECGAEVVRRDSRVQAEHERRFQNQPRMCLL